MIKCVGEFDEIDVSTGVQDIVCICDEVDEERTHELNTNPDENCVTTYTDSLYWKDWEAVITKSGVLKFKITSDSEEENLDDYYWKYTDVDRTEDCLTSEGVLSETMKICIDLDIISDTVGLEFIRYIEPPYYNPWGREDLVTEIVLQSKMNSRCCKAYDKILWKYKEKLVVYFSDPEIETGGIYSLDLFLKQPVFCTPPVPYESKVTIDQQSYLRIEYQTGFVTAKPISEEGPLRKRNWMYCSDNDSSKFMFIFSGADLPRKLQKPEVIKSLQLHIGDIIVKKNDTPIIYFLIADCRDFIKNSLGVISVDGSIMSDAMLITGKKDCLFVYSENTSYDNDNIINDLRIGGTNDVDWFELDYRDVALKKLLDKSLGDDSPDYGCAGKSVSDLLLEY